MEYIAKAERYETMKYNRCGKERPASSGPVAGTVA